ncbi:H-NS histone family protein [Niveibacterium sp. SC-1]|uniref:H-NS histone family protein n=1 Tax=Niveibacterium sp. SC-1 TaxID=3135646 RepID=UPI00311DC92C
MEIAKLNLAELKRLAKRIESEIERRASATKKDVLKKMHKIAADAGISLEDLIGTKKEKAPARKPRAAKGTGRKPAVRRSVGVAKYRNPADASQTWTGKGRKPLWAQAWIDSGKPLGDLEIK